MVAAVLVHREGLEASAAAQRRGVLEHLRRLTGAELGEPSVPLAVVVALWPGDLDAPADALRPIRDGIERAGDTDVGLLVVLVDGALLPPREALPAALRSLADAPAVEPAELGLVLDALPDSDRLGGSAERPPLSRLPAPRRRPSPNRLGRRADRPSGGFLARRDPILLRMAASSGAIGLVLWATLGFHAASLFLFLSTVSFLISRRSED